MKEEVTSNKLRSDKLFCVLLVTFSLLVTFTLPPSVLAHILKTDGSIGAVLHIDSEDDPIAKQPSGFFFEFKDTRSVFQLERCDCEVFIYQAGKQLYTQLLTPISKESPNSANFVFSFPEKDVYQVKVLGKPNVYNEFPNFSLTYDIRVARENTSANQVTANVNNNWFAVHTIHLVGGGMVLLFLIFALLKQRFKRT